MKLRSDNAILKANQLKLETAVAEQNKVLEQQEKDLKEGVPSYGRTLNFSIKLTF